MPRTVSVCRFVWSGVGGRTSGDRQFWFKEFLATSELKVLKVLKVPLTLTSMLTSWDLQLRSDPQSDSSRSDYYTNLLTVFTVTYI